MPDNKPTAIMFYHKIPISDLRLTKTSKLLKRWLCLTQETEIMGDGHKDQEFHRFSSGLTAEHSWRDSPTPSLFLQCHSHVFPLLPWYQLRWPHGEAEQPIDVTVSTLLLSPPQKKSHFLLNQQTEPVQWFRQFPGTHLPPDARETMGSWRQGKEKKVGPTLSPTTSFHQMAHGLKMHFNFSQGWLISMDGPQAQPLPDAAQRSRLPHWWVSRGHCPSPLSY